jgi:hypothetical protein
VPGRGLGGRPTRWRTRVPGGRVRWHLPCRRRRGG